MFSDLVGSTALSARMDPEDLREVISAYQTCITETVQRFGFVAKYMGDGVLVYFGYPQAHEDDAERAVRAGLELLAAVGDLKTHAALQTRVGIAITLRKAAGASSAGPSRCHVTKLSQDRAPTMPTERLKRRRRPFWRLSATGKQFAQTGKAPCGVRSILEWGKMRQNSLYDFGLDQLDLLADHACAGRIWLLPPLYLRAMVRKDEFP
jgi:hypothetical protein